MSPQLRDSRRIRVVVLVEHVVDDAAAVAGNFDVGAVAVAVDDGDTRRRRRVGLTEIG